MRRHPRRAWSTGRPLSAPTPPRRSEPAGRARPQGIRTQEIHKQHVEHHQDGEGEEEEDSGRGKGRDPEAARKTEATRWHSSSAESEVSLPGPGRTGHARSIQAQPRVARDCFGLFLKCSSSTQKYKKTSTHSYICVMPT